MIDALEAGEDRAAPRTSRRTLVQVLILGGLFLTLAGRLDAQVAVTVVMKSGERHTGENPHLSEGGDFGLRRKSDSELRTKASLIAYVEFAPLRHPPPATGGVAAGDHVTHGANRQRQGHRHGAPDARRRVVGLRRAFS